MRGTVATLSVFTGFTFQSVISSPVWCRGSEPCSWAFSWWSCRLNIRIESLQWEFWPPPIQCLQVLRTWVPEPF
jgi:hypothetical protein